MLEYDDICVGDRVEYTGSMSPDIKGLVGTVTSKTLHDNINVKWDDAPHKRFSVMPCNLSPEKPILRVGDRVQYVGDVSNFHQGKCGTILRINENKFEDCYVEFDDGTHYTPLLSSLKPVISSKPRKKNNMNPLQTKIVNHLSDGSNMRRSALRDLIELGALNTHETEAGTREAVEGYLKDNHRGFCAEGIRRFREACGLKKQAWHLMDFPRPSYREERYHTLCGLTHRNAGEIVHSEQYELTDSDKGELCEDCIAILHRVFK